MADISTLMEQLKTSIENGDVTHDNVLDTCYRIEKGQITLLTLIENLACPLLDENPSKRCSAVSILAKVVELLLTSNTLGGKDLEVLADFFCSKLKDHHSILPSALDGLKSLSFSHELPEGLATVIVHSIFQEVHCQSQLQTDRRKIYIILKNFLAYRLKELQALGQDFTFNFIQVVDQERDPRNLLIIFSCIPVIANFIKIEPFAEEFFEVFSCYFPIDFNAPIDDPYGVTRDQLVNGLRQSMASSSQFAEYCLPLLHSKMESDVLTAKIDAWKTLEICCDVYTASPLENWIQVFWDIAHKELLINVNGEELEHSILDALTAVSKAFTSPSGVSDSAAFMKMFQEIINECKGHLCEPERRLMSPSLNILLALCAGNRGACSFITCESIPLLLDQYGMYEDIMPRQFLINALNKIVNAGLHGFTVQNVGDSGVFKWSKLLVALYLNILNHEEDAILKCLSLRGLLELIPTGILKKELPQIMQLAVEYLVYKQSEPEVVHQIDVFFQSVASHEEALICQQVIPPLLQHIEKGHANYERALLIICHLRLPITIQSETIFKLLEILESAPKYLVQTSILNALSEICEHQGKLFSQVEIFWRLHLWTLENIGNNGLFLFELVSSSSGLLRSISSSLSLSDATAIAHQLADLYLKNCYLENLPTLVFTMESTMGSLNATVDRTVLAKIIAVLEPLALSDLNCQVRQSACRLISALLNKSPEGSDFDTIINSLVKHIDCASKMKPENAVYLYIWIVKGLVMRGYSKIGNMVHGLINFLDDEKTKDLAAEGFSIILSDTVECLNTRSHANIRLLYRQRFFQLTVPCMLAAYRQSSNPNPAYLAAVANQLSYMPKGILVSYANDLIVMFVQCLTPEQNDHLNLSTMKLIMELTSENMECIIGHIDALISRLISLGKKGRLLDVRRRALKCLGLLTNAPTALIIPLRSQVVVQLVHCLGDKKRLVRREAALCRHKWIMLGQPGGSKINSP